MGTGFVRTALSGFEREGYYLHGLEVIKCNQSITDQAYLVQPKCIKGEVTPGGNSNGRFFLHVYIR